MNYALPKQERLGIAAIVPIILEAGKVGFEAYTGYVEKQNLAQQQNSQMAIINAMRNLQAANTNSQQSSNKNLPLYVAGGAALLILLTQLT